MIEGRTGVNPHTMYTDGFADGYAVAQKEQPRAKGEWTERKEYSYGWLLQKLPNDKLEFLNCSVCGRWCEHIKGHIPHNYCPHCGAKMIGQIKEQTDGKEEKA